MSTTNIPFGSEFSPSQIDLHELLGLCFQYNGQKDALETAIRQKYFSEHSGGNAENQKKLAMNCRLGLKAYLIIDEHCYLTDFGKSLFEVKNDLDELYKSLAKHILLNLNGMAFIQCLRDMTLALEDINLTSLRASLAERGIHYPYLSGLALEALAFKLMRFLAMDYVATRLRAQSTGGAEVDLIFESARLVFSCWQIQCKNTAHVSLDDVAKEVGLTHFLKSNVIVVVSTGTIGTEARRYSNKIMRDSNLSIVLLDKDDLAKITADVPAILDIFHREAKTAMELKKLEM